MADSADLVHRGHHALALALQEISRRSDTGNVLVDDDVAVYATGHPEAEFYNGVLRLNTDSDPERLIRRADAYFTSRSNGYTVWALLGRDEDLVPRQATFARFTSSRSALSSALRFRQMM